MVLNVQLHGWELEGVGGVWFFRRTVFLVLAVEKKQKWCLGKCCRSSSVSFGIQGKKWRGLFSFSGLPLGWGWLMKCCFVDFIFNFSKPTFKHPTWTGFGAKAFASFPALSHSQGARWAPSSKDRKQTFYLFMCHSVAAVCTVHYCLICLKRVVLNVLGLVWKDFPLHKTYILSSHKARLSVRWSSYSIRRVENSAFSCAAALPISLTLAATML